MSASPRLFTYLKLDRAVSTQLRVRSWQKERAERATGIATGHDAVEITWVESGTVEYTVAGRQLVATAGDLVVVPHGVVHTTSFQTPMRGLALWVGADLVREIAETMGPEVSAPVGGLRRLEVDNRRIHTLLAVLHDEVEDHAVGHARAAEGIAESIVIEMLRRAPRRTVDARRFEPRVRTAIEHMLASLADPIGVDDLARAAGLSRFHFSRLFRDETGQAPYQYLLALRIARARQLLQRGHDSVTEVALASGFTNFSRFSSTFKKHTGMRPVDVLRTARSA